MADYDLDTEYTFDCRFEVNAVACDWGDIEGDINNQTDLKDALDNKADVETVNGIDERLETVENIIDDYGNIVTHDTDEFATAEQGTLADTSLQPNDNISELNNDAGYITSSALPTVNNSKITIQKNGTKVDDFTLNQSADKSINITVPTQLSELGTETQMSAINSGMNSTLAGQITTNQNAISLINGKIPSQASSSNQLADKDFVNSSISTNTANFIGTFNSVAELEAYSGTLTNNDYAFVIGTDGDGNTVYNRYKYTTATTPASWIFEYALNNSSFTANQWASINSGANATNIGQIAINTNAITLINTTIGGYGDIVTHDASEFATAQQGSLADTSLQPNDNISELVNDAGYTSNVGTVTKVNNTSPDANGNVSISIPPAQVQADWDVTDTNSKAYIKNKPYIPSGVVVDQNYDATSTNAQSGTAVAEALTTIAVSDDKLHALKGWSESGQVYSDTTLYNDIYAQYLTSTTTGTDLIITDNYTVVGSPTITDGVMSNINGSNYATSGTFLNNLGDYDTWEIEIPTITATATSPTYYGTLIHNNLDNDLAIHIDMNNSHVLRVYLKATDGTHIWYGTNTPDTFALNSQLDVKIKFTGTQYLIQTRISGEDWKTQLTANNSKKLYKTNLPILFGSAGTGGNSNWYNSINLYGIRFIGNNKLIYAGKCQIPYNISDNGNKIVDVQYRPDVYYANYLGYKSSYFTIDTVNQNVTLPYRNLYALITQSFNYNYSRIQGYNATATQTLKHVNGVLQWVTD